MITPSFLRNVQFKISFQVRFYGPIESIRQYRDMHHRSMVVLMFKLHFHCDVMTVGGWSQRGFLGTGTQINKFGASKKSQR